VVRGNRLIAPVVAGILGGSFSGQCEVVENHVLNAASDRAGLGIGIALVVSSGGCRVEANEVRDTGITPAGASIPPRALGIVVLYVQQAQVDGNRVDYSDRFKRDPNAEDRALLMQGLFEWVLNAAGTAFVLGSPVQIVNNIFAGCGRTALIELREASLPLGGLNPFLRFERVQFSGNDCWHVVPKQYNAAACATVWLVGRNLSVGHNEVRALDRRYASYHLHGRKGPFIANVSSGPVLGRAPVDEFPTPQVAFNMTV
jgi:hypothetical protein